MKFPIARFETLETPFYYYDLTLLNDTINKIKSCIRNHDNYHVHYAVKANANPRILSLIAQAGLGADCVSGGEIKVAAEAGFPSGSIVFAGVGKTDKEIRTALQAHIGCFNVESIPELENISRIAESMDASANVCFRINPNVDAHTHAKITTGLNENKFGIAIEDVDYAIKRASELPCVNYTGLHFHIGSQILDLSVFEELCKRINDIQDHLAKKGIPAAQNINVGGGLGIDYEDPDHAPIPDFEEYFNIFTKALQLREGQQLHFELGRSIVAQCGSLISRVLYVKQGHTKQFVIVDAGFTDLVRPAMYGAHHYTQNITAKDPTPEAAYDVVGPICESSDVFSTHELLPVTHRGDLIAFRSAGAYGEVMASCYNCRELPKSYFRD